ncbi:MAG: GTP 3',8-cyclase MoaA [Clostridia bacterium]|nr:GTP 3',8-cyclase MoaA [Clostridia bacterium]
MAGPDVQAMPTRGPLIDQFGRVVRKLRVSLTDRCNFRCVYCMPEDAEFMPRDELLTFDEIERVVRICASMGVDTIRLTGGEPLLRPGVAEITARLKRVPGIRKVSMTTNGYMLPHLAHDLKRAGLDGINISLDTLDRERFKRIARRDYIDHVHAGLRAAEEAGLRPIKINCVVMRGINDDEVPDFLRWAREFPYVVRFIEFMPLDGDNIWQKRLVFPMAEILERAREVAPFEEVAADKASPARTFRFLDGKGEFGVIASVTAPFCAHCDRIRLTQDGKIRNCLFAVEETDLRELLRGGADDDAVERRIREAVWSKWAGHRIDSPDFVKPKRAMYKIGG